MLYAEPVEVDLAAHFFSGVVEEGEALSAEVGHVVVHLKRVADGVPLLAVKTVKEGGLVGTVAKIMIHTEPHLRLCKRFGLDVLSLGITKGTEISIGAEGADEEAAVAALEQLIQTGFKEFEG